MTAEETLKELNDTPAEFLTPVETTEDFKPFAQVDSTLAGNLANGKDDIQEGQTDDIITDHPEGLGNDVTPEIDPATGQPIPSGGNNDMEFNAAEFVTTDMALALIGFIVIFFGVMAFNKFGHIAVKNEELELTAEEKKTLKKPLDKCLESIKVKSVNPWVALIICLVVLYGLKFAAIIMANKEKEKELNAKEQELLAREQKIKAWEDTPEERRIPYKPAEQQTIQFTETPHRNNNIDLTPNNAPYGYGKDGKPKKDNRGRKPKTA